MSYVVVITSLSLGRIEIVITTIAHKIIMFLDEGLHVRLMKYLSAFIVAYCNKMQL